MTSEWAKFVKRQADKGKDKDKDIASALTGFVPRAPFGPPPLPHPDVEVGFGGFDPPSEADQALSEEIVGKIPGAGAVQGFAPGEPVGFGSTPEIVQDGGALGKVLGAPVDPLGAIQESVKMNVGLLRSVLPEGLAGTGERAAELREGGTGTIAAAMQAAEEAPLLDVPIHYPTVSPSALLQLWEFLPTIGRELNFQQSTGGITPVDLKDIVEIKSIGVPGDLLAEMALDYLNLLVVLGPSVNLSRKGLEFLAAAQRSGLRQAGETLPQFARRLAKPLQGERGFIGKAPPGKEPSDIGKAPPGKEPSDIGKAPPGKEPSDIQRALKDAQELQSATPPPHVPTTASGTMPSEKADEIIEWFGNLIASPESIEAHVLTEKLRTAARAERIFNLETALKKGLDEGLDVTVAWQRALAEMGGPLPGVDTGLRAMATQQIKDALASRVITALAGDYFEMMSTMTALDKALSGATISRKLGTGSRAFPEGGSEYKRLQRVFPQEIVDALDGQAVDDLIAIKMAKAPETLTSSGPIPPSRPFIQSRLGEEAQGVEDLRLISPEKAPPTPGTQPAPGVRPPAGEFAGPIGGEAPELRQFPVDASSPQQKQFDLDMFKAAIEGKVPAERVPSTKLAATIDDVAVKQVELMPNPDRQLIVQTLKLAGMNAMDIGNFLRANMASADISWLRQQAMLIFGNPTSLPISIWKSLRAAWSKEYADELMDAIYRSPLYKNVYTQTGGDFLRPLSGEVGMLADAAEDFQALAFVKGETNLRPFQALAEKLPWIRISARAHVIGTNTMNWRIYEKHYEYMLRIRDEIAAGRIALPKGEKVHDVAKEMELFGKMLADMSGRAPLHGTIFGREIDFRSSAPFLNSLFFSPRLALGRLLSLTPRHLFSESKYVKRAAWKNLLSFIGGMSGILWAGKFQGWWDLEVNPESADFMKILTKGGRIRVDPWGGFQQWVVLFGRILVNLPNPPEAKSTTTGRVSEVDPGDLLMRFGKTKASPAMSNILELWLKEDFKGDEIDRTDWLRWVRRNSPLAALDIYEAFEAEGLTGIGPGSVGIVGGGVLVYELPNWPELDKYYNYTRNHPDAMPEQVRAWKKGFRSNSENEAKLFVRGHIETLSSEKASVRVQELMLELKLTPKNVPGYEKVFQTTEWPPGSGNRSTSESVETAAGVAP